jgi:hypothetical protein
MVGTPPDASASDAFCAPMRCYDTFERCAYQLVNAER